MKLRRHEVVRSFVRPSGRQPISADFSSEVELLCKEGHLTEALFKLASSQQGAVVPSRTYKCLLQSCTFFKALAQGQVLHAHVISAAPLSLAPSESTLVHLYAQCGCLEDARHVFDHMQKWDVFVWNVMIAAYTRHGLGKEALNLFHTMDQASLRRDEITYVSILKACKVHGNVSQGRWVHSCAVKMQCDTYMSVQNSLLGMYTHHGSLLDAYVVFAHMEVRDVVSWTLMISGYSMHGYPQEALSLYAQMESKEVCADKVTFLSTLQACSSLGNMERGREIHGEVVLGGFDAEPFVASTLVDMYSKCGSIDEAQRLFELSPTKDSVSCNSLISGYAEHNRVEEAFKLFGRIFLKGLKPDKITFLNIINACLILGDIKVCVHVHMHLVNDGFESDVQITNSVLDMYAKCGYMEDAHHIFKHCREKDVVSWTTIISGYAKQGLGEEAFHLLELMKKDGVNPDKFTCVGILKACVGSENLDQGRLIHAYVTQSGLELDAFMESTLVDLYSKGGHLCDARQVFDNINKHDVVSWTAMIVGYAQHGCGSEALKLMEQMLHSGVTLNYVTLMGVLSACSHSGLVDESQHLLDIIKEKSKVRKTAEHYACMIDLLTRAGCLDEAERLLVELPFEPSVSMWLTLLRSCSTYGHVTLAKRAAEHVLRLDPENDAVYVLLSNVCATGGGSISGDEFYEAGDPVHHLQWG